jgi:hypothetical protein
VWGVLVKVRLIDNMQGLSPSPDSYNQSSGFDSSKKTVPSYTFGVSRNAYEKVHTDGMTHDPNL